MNSSAAPATGCRRGATEDTRNRRSPQNQPVHGNGVQLIGTGTGALSTPMTTNEIELLAQAMLDGSRAVKAQLLAQGDRL